MNLSRLFGSVSESTSVCRSMGMEEISPLKFELVKVCMNKIKMGKLSELAPGKVLVKKILARRIAVFNDNGKLYGLEADCKHMKASLATGKVNEGIVACSWHDWRYDMATGKCLTVEKMDLKTYQIEVDGDDILLLM